MTFSKSKDLFWTQFCHLWSDRARFRILRYLSSSPSLLYKYINRNHTGIEQSENDLKLTFKCLLNKVQKVSLLLANRKKCRIWHKNTASNTLSLPKFLDTCIRWLLFLSCLRVAFLIKRSEHLRQKWVLVSEIIPPHTWVHSGTSLNY